MKTLKEYIDGLRYIKSGPVSFKFHTHIGNILESGEDQADSIMEADKVLLNSEDIPFIL